MQTNIHFWPYLAQFFLESEMYYKTVVEEIYIFCAQSLFFENHTVYDVMQENVLELGSPPMTVRRMRIACWIPRVTNTHSEYVILIAVILQRRLHERASLLHYTYIALLCPTSLF